MNRNHKNLMAYNTIGNGFPAVLDCRKTILQVGFSAQKIFMDSLDLRKFRIH
jgi:hypothetical protein